MRSVDRNEIVFTSNATAALNLLANVLVWVDQPVAKAGYCRQLCVSQSARCIAAHLYTAAGSGESTTDLAWDGHALIYENGDKLAESERFASDTRWSRRMWACGASPMTGCG
jgi:NAD+ synthase (glutamine-hydrolysing)